MRRGFTLIELLVVMTIISILASLLFPVFSRARGKAVETNCLSNIRQICMATLMYAGDYDELMPPGAAPWWGDRLQPYMKNYQILACPLEPNYNPGYAMNYWLDGESLVSVDYVAQVVMYGDATVPAAWYLYPETAPEGDPDPDENPDTFGSTVDFRHNNNSANFAYCDGHAKRMMDTCPAADDFLTTWDPEN